MSCASSFPRNRPGTPARGPGDENAEYHMTLQRQQYVKARVMQLRDRIGALARVNLGSIPRDKAAYGSYLRLFDVDKEEELEVYLVTHEEARYPEGGHYSVQSPVGKAMLGKRVGDEVTVDTPGGKRNSKSWSSRRSTKR